MESKALAPDTVRNTSASAPWQRKFCSQKCCDCNRDGIIDAVDAQCILRMSVGLLSLDAPFDLDVDEAVTVGDV